MFAALRKSLLNRMCTKSCVLLDEQNRYSTIQMECHTINNCRVILTAFSCNVIVVAVICYIAFLWAYSVQFMATLKLHWCDKGLTIRYKDRSNSVVRENVVSIRCVVCPWHQLGRQLQYIFFPSRSNFWVSFCWLLFSLPFILECNKYFI